MTKRALIIGIDSFTGYHLSIELQKFGYQVYGSALNPKDMTYSSVLAKVSNLSDEIFQCDITVKEQIFSVIKKVNPAYIFHLSGISFVAHDDWEEIYRVNLQGVINLLWALKHSKINLQKLLIPSSANVYRPKDDGRKIAESAELGPISHYAISKIAMEYACQMDMDKIPLLLVRPFNYTGIGQSKNFLIPKIVDHYVQKKSYIELGNLNVVRDISDVRFLVKVYRMLAESSIHSEIFNICSGRGITIQEILNYAEQLTHYKLEVKVNPAFIRTNEIKSVIGDNSKLMSQFNLDIIPIKETIQWMIAEKL